MGLQWFHEKVQYQITLAVDHFLHSFYQTKAFEVQNIQSRLKAKFGFQRWLHERKSERKVLQIYLSEEQLAS